MKRTATIPVDFSNCDIDGAVRLVTKGTVEFREKHGIEFTEGMTIVMSDGELFAEGVLLEREGFWVAKIVAWPERN